MENFEIAGGTVVGKHHRLLGLNNQDTYRWFKTPEALVAIVCDGCSEGKQSEVGANIGAELILSAFQRQLSQIPELPKPTEVFFERVRQEVLAEIRVMCLMLGNSLTDTVVNNFLFTTVGAIVTPKRTLIFSIGDGVVGWNNLIEKLSPRPGNQPAYLGYGLFQPLPKGFVEDDIRFQIQVDCPTEEVSSIFLASDGLVDLMHASLKPIPGKTEMVGPLSQFWQEDSYFSNTDKIRRKLHLVAREVIKLNSAGQIEKETGWLEDDTTLIVIRRKPAKTEA
ncbi:MAG: protein phosphatase 2C domain-containing protein [Patescibacteria group bacterium]